MHLLTATFKHSNSEQDSLYLKVERDLVTARMVIHTSAAGQCDVELPIAGSTFHEMCVAFYNVNPEMFTRLQHTVKL